MQSGSFVRALCGAAALLATLAGGAQAQEAQVRVVHASPDAPNVDVCVDGVIAFPNVGFNTATAYVTVPEATYDVNVIAAGGACNVPGVITASLPLAGDTTVVAVNTLASIEPLVLADDNTLPATRNTRVRFVHASPDAPTVDIAVAGSPADEPIFDNISFKGVGDYVEIPGGTYDLEVRDASGTVVALPLPGVTFSPGVVYTVFATGLFNGSPAIGVLVTEDAGTPEVFFADVRVVHASPDAPNVDVCVDGAVVFPDVAFNTATAYVTVPEATYNVNVIAAGGACNEPGVIEAALPLAGATTVVAVNTLADIEPLVLADDNTLPAPGDARLRFVHASPDAPAVDIAVAGSAIDAPLFDNIAFKGVGDYLSVPGGTYDLEVRDTTGTAVVLALPGVPLSAGVVYTVFATGLLAGDPALGVLLTVDAGTPEEVGEGEGEPEGEGEGEGQPEGEGEGQPEGEGEGEGQPEGEVEGEGEAEGEGQPEGEVEGEGETETPFARVRVAHLSPDAPEVAVCADGAALFPRLPFNALTPYRSVPADTYNVNVVPFGASCMSAGVIQADLALSGDLTVAAVNTLENIEPIILVDDNTPPAAGNAKLRFVHASPDAPAVDVAVVGSEPDAPLFNDIPFKGVGDYLEVPAGDYPVEVRDATGTTVVLSLGTLSLADGVIYTVFATGLLSGEPALGAKIALDNVDGPAGSGPVHSLDQDGDSDVSLSELLRLIQFYNSDNYGCAAGTEDGYAPNTADQACAPHASDYNPQDWEIALTELLRAIQFYNSGGYYACADAPPAEDGYCVPQL
jgi:hypothetical protein